MADVTKEKFGGILWDHKKLLFLVVVRGVDQASP